MKIIFAGTSHGIPEKGAFCSSTFLVINNSVYIIDAGAPISGLLLNYSLRHEDVRAVFNTHMHGDHFDGLPEFCGQITWKYTDSKPKFFLPDERGKVMLKNWVHEMVRDPSHPEQLDIEIYSSGVVYEDENVKFTAVKTNHIDYSYAFTVEAENKRLFFTGDMSFGYGEYETLLGDRDYDLVVCEGAHHIAGEANEKLKNTRTKKLIVNHISPAKRDGYAPLYDIDGFDFDIAHDGLILEI